MGHRLCQLAVTRSTGGSRSLYLIPAWTGRVGLVGSNLVDMLAEGPATGWVPQRVHLETSLGRSWWRADGCS